MKEKIKVVAVSWTIGVIGMLLFWFYWLTTRVKLQGYSWKKLKPGKNKGLIVIHNHPSLWEPAVLPFLFSPLYLFSPRFVPFSTPDKKNYYDKWWFFYRNVCIPVERGNLKEEARALMRMQKKLREGGVIIMAPEGGRTYKGEEFKVIKNGRIEIVKDISEIDLTSTKAVRRFKAGIGRLVYNTEADVIPLWTEGGDEVVQNKSNALYSFPRLWKRARIKIGEPLDLDGLSKKEVVGYLEDSLLRTGVDD